eukprot:403351856
MELQKPLININLEYLLIEVQKGGESHSPQKSQIPIDLSFSKQEQIITWYDVTLSWGEKFIKLSQIKQDNIPAKYLQLANNFYNFKRDIQEYTIKSFQQKKFTFIEILGEGLTSRVFKVKKNSNPNKFYALKVINKLKLDEDLKESIYQEVCILRKLKYCSNINQLIRIYENKQNLYLLLEFKDGGDLKKYILKSHFIPEFEIKLILAQLLLTLDYFQKRNIIHKDLKPENILLCLLTNEVSKKDLEVTIADFGFAIDITSQNIDDTVVCGTAGYFAPEVLKGGKYGFKSDIFSLGCILYNLICRKQLFYGSTQREVLIKNKRCLISESFSKDISKFSSKLQDLLSLMINENPQDRLNANEALYHPFFNEIRGGIDEALLNNIENFNNCQGEWLRSKQREIQSINQQIIKQNASKEEILEYQINQQSWEKKQKKTIGTCVTQKNIYHVSQTNQNEQLKKLDQRICFSSYLQVIRNSMKVKKQTHNDLENTNTQKIMHQNVKSLRKLKLNKYTNKQSILDNSNNIMNPEIMINHSQNKGKKQKLIPRQKKSSLSKRKLLLLENNLSTSNDKQKQAQIKNGNQLNIQIQDNQNLIAPLMQDIANNFGNEEIPAFNIQDCIIPKIQQNSKVSNNLQEYRSLQHGKNNQCNYQNESMLIDDTDIQDEESLLDTVIQKYNSKQNISPTLSKLNKKETSRIFL